MVARSRGAGEEEWEVTVFNEDRISVLQGEEKEGGDGCAPM